MLGPDGGWTTAEAVLLKEAKEKQGKHYCFFLSLSLYSPFFLFVKILPTSMIENLNLRLCSDQMEEWTTAEAALFEEAMEKHGKTFNDIWTDYLPWKTVKVRFIVRYSKGVSFKNCHGWVGVAGSNLSEINFLTSFSFIFLCQAFFWRTTMPRRQILFFS